jgi:effector-binding domain-containing protein
MHQRPPIPLDFHESRLKDKAMNSEPIIEEFTAQPYVAIKAKVTMDTLGTVVPPLTQEVFAWLAEHGIPPSGPPFWKFNVIDMAHGMEMEVEAGTMVAVTPTGGGRVLASVLPAGRYATLRHVGHPATLMDATAALIDWAKSKGLRWDMSLSDEGERWGCRMEIYHTDPRDEPDMNKWETQLAFRIADDSGVG